MENINRYIEHTNLSPELVDADIDRLVMEARDHHLLGICVPPFWVKKAKREIGESDIQLVTVIGFPLGYNMTETKLLEMEMAIENGVNELDLVMNISAFKTGMPWAKIEIAKCAKLAHDGFCSLKVIVETDYLSAEELTTACRLCSDAGADFVKTSTGFALSGAKLEDIKLMRGCLPSNVGIKASGGIKTFEQVSQLIEAGADRIGTSSGVSIISNPIP
ncbi:deoxyribose-phosphate aldolase [Fulvivirgaceae bacterium BMA10]|uniref:Deoxyribose-phosphate aldolase n=1 Tax=Splendidivirga corallicola TaxID=3051826 RepID=A0ABT8KLN0_9BACT|nr:deoxyribose-phosphate aldolase [Fulvivirgaceae bacterium BMA10]